MTIWRAFVIVRFPYSKELVGQLLRSNGKRSIGMILILWQTGSSLASNVTAVDTSLKLLVLQMHRPMDKYALDCHTIWAFPSSLERPEASLLCSTLSLCNCLAHLAAVVSFRLLCKRDCEAREALWRRSFLRSSGINAVCKVMCSSSLSHTTLSHTSSSERRRPRSLASI